MLAEVAAAPGTLVYLGPAEVVETHGQTVTVRIGPEREVSAELALAFPYEPARGDLLLVIGHRDEHYVIGVLRGAGDAALAIQGNVSLRAVDGKLELKGDRGVALDGPKVDVTTERFTMMAGTMVQKCTHAFQRVRELLTFRAGRVHSVVDQSSYSKAKSTVIVSDERVMINGKQIHLG